jgi:hypothetical protein
LRLSSGAAPQRLNRVSRSVLRTLSETILTHLRTIRNSIERIRNRSRDSADDEETKRRK